MFCMTMHDNLKTPTRTWNCRRCTMQIRYFYASDLPFKNFCKLSKKVFWIWLSIVWETEWRVFVLNKRKSLRVQWEREQILFIQIAKLKTFFTLRNSPFPLTQSIKVHRRALVLPPCLIHSLRKQPRPFLLPARVEDGCFRRLPFSLPSPWKIRKGISQLSPFDHAKRQHTRKNPRQVRGPGRIYDVRMAQFVLKIEKLSHIMGPRGSQDLRSPSPIMAPGDTCYKSTIFLNHVRLCVLSNHAHAQRQ